jgi:hypothetical protein
MRKYSTPQGVNKLMGKVFKRLEEVSAGGGENLWGYQVDKMK